MGAVQGGRPDINLSSVAPARASCTRRSTSTRASSARTCSREAFVAGCAGPRRSQISGPSEIANVPISRAMRTVSSLSNPISGRRTTIEAAASIALRFWRVWLDTSPRLSPARRPADQGPAVREEREPRAVRLEHEDAPDGLHAPELPEAGLHPGEVDRAPVGGIDRDRLAPAQRRDHLPPPRAEELHLPLHARGAILPTGHAEPLELARPSVEHEELTRRRLAHQELD